MMEQCWAQQGALRAPFGRLIYKAMRLDKAESAYHLNGFIARYRDEEEAGRIGTPDPAASSAALLRSV